jgi:serine/threonine protein phosphatase 1
MNEHELAVIGDIHGNAVALDALLQYLEGRVSKYVFVGDYVNRGPDSSRVIDLLIELSGRHQSAFVAGNHDLAFLNALEEGPLSTFLRIGGAATVRSYVPTPTGDVLEALRTAVPYEHREFLKSMTPHFRGSSGLLVTHRPNDRPIDAPASVYHVYGHQPQRSGAPWIGERHAAIDTGCGTLPNGRLTALFVPDRTYVQVSEVGDVVPSSRS